MLKQVIISKCGKLNMQVSITKAGQNVLTNELIIYTLSSRFINKLKQINKILIVLTKMFVNNPSLFLTKKNIGKYALMFYLCINKTTTRDQ